MLYFKSSAFPTLLTLLIGTTLLGAPSVVHAQPIGFVKSTAKLSKSQQATIRRMLQDVISIGGLNTNGRPLSDEQMVEFAINWNFLRHEKRFTKLPNDQLRLSSKHVTDCCLAFFGRAPRHKSVPQRSWKYRNGSYTGHISDMEGLYENAVKTIQLSRSNQKFVAVVTWIDDFGGETIVRDRIFLKSDAGNPARFHVLRTQSITAR